MSRQPRTFPSRPRKRWGQHFLLDPNQIRNIVESSRLEGGDSVLEIGPGRGSLTGPLCGAARSVTAVEIDPELVGFLRERFRDFPNLSVVCGDFLNFDLAALARDQGGALVVVGNIPYNISAPILFRLLDSRSSIRSATLMLQKEVADRILARPGSKAYGVLSLLIPYEARAKRLFSLPPSAFRPKPKVDSTVIRLDFEQPHPRRTPYPHLFRGMVKAGFGNRRKMLKNALGNSPSVPVDTGMVLDALSACSLNPKARAENLELDDFLKLTEVLASRIQGLDVVEA